MAGQASAPRTLHNFPQSSRANRLAAGRRSSQSVPDAYDLTASSWIGAIETPTVSLVVQPKFDIDNVMFHSEVFTYPRTVTNVLTGYT